MIEAIKKKLQTELEALNHELGVVLPETLRRAVALGDLKENGDYHAARERQQFVTARLSQLRYRLGQLSQIDLSKIPEGMVGLGTRLVVLDMDTREKEKLELVIPEAMDFEGGQISVSSPLGRALLEKKVGETVTVRLSDSVRKLKIVELATFHEQIQD